MDNKDVRSLLNSATVARNKVVVSSADWAGTVAGGSVACVRT